MMGLKKKESTLIRLYRSLFEFYKQSAQFIQAEKQHEYSANRYGQIGVSGGKVPGCVWHAHSDLKNHKTVSYQDHDKNKEYKVDNYLKFSFPARLHFVDEKIHNQVIVRNVQGRGCEKHRPNKNQTGKPGDPKPGDAEKISQ
jgi:hypothetical protein